MKHFGWLGTWLLIASAGGYLEAQTISTAAGNTSWPNVRGVIVDRAGNILCTSGNRVLRINRLGEETVIAGQAAAGFGGDGGPATQALLRNPLGLALAADGTLYIADQGNHLIRRVSPNGVITTFAGTGRGFSGDGGPANQARLLDPQDVILDSAGNLLVTDTSNYRIRRITPAGIISTIAGTGRNGFGGDGGPPLLADMTPGWLAFGPDGTLYVSDDGDLSLAGNKRVRQIRNNVVTTVAGNGQVVSAGDGGQARNASFRSADGIAIDGAGNIYVAEHWSSRVRRISPDGIITTYAGTGDSANSGDGGPANLARMNDPVGLAIDLEGNLLIADSGNSRVRRVSQPRPTISTTNAVTPSFSGRAGFGSNMYVEIYGTNLSTSTRVWGGADFNGSRAPTVLDGVSVTVNGRPAFVYYISPTQININTPEDTATGTVNIQVTNSLGSSNIGVATRARVSPTLHSIPQFASQGRAHVVAQTPDFRSFVGPPGMVTGVNFNRARPGDRVVIYALGCGPTNPPTEAGVAAAQNSPLALPFELRIGGQRAEVAFAGVAAGTIGLYQINVTIPSVPGGDQPIELTVDGTPNNQNLHIAIDGPAAVNPPPVPATGGFRFARIADNSASSPYGDFQGDFSINDRGWVAFTGIRRDGSVVANVSDGTSDRLLAATGVDGISRLITGGINSQGTVVMSVMRATGGAIVTGNGGPLSTVATSLGIVPSLTSLPDINDQGTVAYLDNQRLIVKRGDEERVILDPALPGPLRGVIPQRLQLNQQGDVLFSTVGIPALYVSRAGSVSQVAGARDTNPTAISFASPTINNRGQVSFHALVESPTDPFAFFSGNIGLPPSPVWRGLPLTSGSLAYDRISMNDTGRLSFVVPSTDRLGLYYGRDLQQNKVIARGDPLFGSTLSIVYGGIGAGGKAINNRGQIVFFYLLENGAAGIAIATPE